MLKQAQDFIKKETPAQVLSLDIYEIFLEHLFIEHFWACALLLLLESSIFWVFLPSNLPNVYLLVFCFTLHKFLFYLSSDNDCINSFDAFKVSVLLWHRPSRLVVHCMDSYLLVRPLDQWQKHLAARFCSRLYIMRSGVGILARKIRLAATRVLDP